MIGSLAPISWKDSGRYHHHHRRRQVSLHQMYHCDLQDPPFWTNRMLSATKKPFGCDLLFSVGYIRAMASTWTCVRFEQAWIFSVAESVHFLGAERTSAMADGRISNRTTIVLRAKGARLISKAFVSGVVTGV